MKFWEMTKDEREQWRAHPVTQAYLEELREQDEALITESINSSIAGRTHEAIVAACKLDGIVHALRIATDEEPR